jgi:hypothetical protein
MNDIKTHFKIFFAPVNTLSRYLFCFDMEDSTNLFTLVQGVAILSFLRAVCVVFSDEKLVASIAPLCIGEVSGLEGSALIIFRFSL